jgi:hypothetical protein
VNSPASAQQANANENPYSAPEARVQDQTDEAAVAEKILGRIRRAWITGVLSGIGTLLTVGMVIAVSSGLNKGLVLFFVDFLLVAGLIYGIYRKSRACAVTMFVYSLIFKLFLIAVIVSSIGNREALLGSSTMFGFSSVFFYFYFYGMLGTYAHHKHLRPANA